MEIVGALVHAQHELDDDDRDSQSGQAQASEQREVAGLVVSDTAQEVDQDHRPGRDQAEGVAQAWQRAAVRFDLVGFAARPVRTYSRGQRQRVALARALVHDPELVLLDEPTAGLDAASTERLAVVIREEADRGATVVVVTHDTALAERGDVRLRLERGRVAPSAATVGSSRT